jgi:hypothetical protein
MQKERDNWKDEDVVERMTLKVDLRELGWGGVDWIDQTQVRGQRKALVNTILVMKFRVS